MYVKKAQGGLIKNKNYFQRACIHALEKQLCKYLEYQKRISVITEGYRNYKVIVNCVQYRGIK